MRRFFAGAAFFVLLAATFPCHEAIAGPSESSVWIEVERESGVVFKGYRLPRLGEGMGALISPFYVATAAHVVSGAKRISVTNVVGIVVNAEVVRIDGSVDVAILRIGQAFRDFALIRPTAATPGERVAVARRLVLNEPSGVSYGVIETINYTSNGVAVPLIFSGIKGEKGQSGGGVFDGKGDLVGIIIRIDAMLGYLNAVPIFEVCMRFSRCSSVVDGKKR